VPGILHIAYIPQRVTFSGEITGRFTERITCA